MRRVTPYLFVAPFFLVFGVFGVYPLFKTAVMSFYKWNLIGDKEFVGFQNYSKLLEDEYFWNAVGNTLGIFVLATVPQLLLALLLATLLNYPMRRMRGFFRMAVFIPNVTSVAAAAIVFGVFFRRDFGVINWLFGTAIDWHTNKFASWVAIATMVDWRWTGYNALILLAAMQAIPKDLYESAGLDGATVWRQFWSITLPMLRPTFMFVVVVSTIGGLQLFTEPLIFNAGAGAILGGAQREFQTVAMYMYERAFNDLAFGYGSAIAWALFLMIVIAALGNYLIVRRSVK